MQASDTTPQPKQIDENLGGEALTRPSHSFENRLRRLFWGVAYHVLFRPSPRIAFGWRRFILKSFGAKIGPGCRIYSKAIVWAPWNLECEDVVLVGDGANIYNVSPVILRSHAIVSSEAFLCGASHDYNDPNFTLIHETIELKPYSWICSRASVNMGCTVGEGAVLALGAVAVKDLKPWTVYGGVPAKEIGTRTNFLKGK